MWLLKMSVFVVIVTELECHNCEELQGHLIHLETQLSDVQIIQDELRRKLSTSKATLAATIERETKLR